MFISAGAQKACSCYGNIATTRRTISAGKLKLNKQNGKIGVNYHKSVTRWSQLQTTWLTLSASHVLLVNTGVTREKYFQGKKLMLSFAPPPPLLPANPAPAFILIFFFRYQIYFWYLLIYSKLRPIVDRILYQCKWNVFDLFIRAVSSNLLFRSCVRLWQRYVFPGEDEVVSLKEVF